MNLAPITIAPTSMFQAPVSPAPTSVPPSAPGAAPTTAALGARYVGMPLQDALQQAEANGETVRVTIQDGQPQIVTMDYRPDRINVAVEADVITAIAGFG